MITLIYVARIQGPGEFRTFRKCVQSNGGSLKDSFSLSRGERGKGGTERQLKICSAKQHLKSVF